MTDEYAKAAQEVAKASGKAIDAAKASGGFLARILEGPLTELAGKWQDSIKARRIENLLEIEHRLRKKAQEMGVNWKPGAIPLAIEVPWIEAASLVEEPDLQETWANLLLNYADKKAGIAQRATFVHLLREMTSLEVHVLDVVYTTKPLGTRQGVLTGGLPNTSIREGPDGERSMTPSEPTPEVSLALSNLIRLGCLVSGSMWDGGEMLSVVYETFLGREFVAACKRKPPARRKQKLARKQRN